MRLTVVWGHHDPKQLVPWKDLPWVKPGPDGRVYACSDTDPEKIGCITGNTGVRLLAGQEISIEMPDGRSRM